MYKLEIESRGKEELIDITALINSLIREHGDDKSLCLVFVPHTTAGITINENADPNVRRDIVLALDHLVPELKDFRHAEGNSTAHVKASLLGSSVQIMIGDKRLLLGTWQGIYLGEFDGPRRRQVWVELY